jgi:purine nucleoside permease
MQSLVVLALPLIGNAIAIPHPQAEPTRVAQLLTTDNSDCSEGSTHNLIDRECLNVATSYFVVSQSNGDVVNPNVGCLGKSFRPEISLCLED